MYACQQKVALARQYVAASVFCILIQALVISCADICYELHRCHDGTRTANFYSSCIHVHTVQLQLVYARNSKFEAPIDSKFDAPIAFHALKFRYWLVLAKLAVLAEYLWHI